MRHAYDEAVYTLYTRLIYTCITLPVRHAYDEAVYTMDTQLIYRQTTLPVRHAYDEAVYTMDTRLIYTSLHGGNQHLTSLQTKPLLRRKFLGEELLKSG